VRCSIRAWTRRPFPASTCTEQLAVNRLKALVAVACDDVEQCSFPLVGAVPSDLIDDAADPRLRGVQLFVGRDQWHHCPAMRNISETEWR
jgi:hypothetical protein